MPVTVASSAPSTAEILATENRRLRAAVEAAEERAEVAEQQLLRVHRAVRAAQQNLKNARQRRNEILGAAQQHAAELIRQAQREAEVLKRAALASASNKQADRAAPPTSEPKPVAIARPIQSWEGGDPSLDDRLDQYLQTELEPDRSREWILGDRTR